MSEQRLAEMLDRLFSVVEALFVIDHRDQCRVDLGEYFGDALVLMTKPLEYRWKPIKSSPSPSASSATASTSSWSRALGAKAAPKIKSCL